MCLRFVHATRVIFYSNNNSSEHLMPKGIGRGSAQTAAGFQLMYFQRCILNPQKPNQEKQGEGQGRKKKTVEVTGNGRVLQDASLDASACINSRVLWFPLIVVPFHR